MGFNISAGVYSTEIDLTTVVPSVATTEGAFAGVFRWGPVGQRVLVDSEKTLVDRFGKPTNLNAETFFTAANFLAYSNKLYVVRAANTSANSTNIANVTLSAVAMQTGTASNTQLATSVVRNPTEIDTVTFDSAVAFVAKYPGALGNSLKVSVVDNANGYSKSIALVANTDVSPNTSIAFVVGANTAALNIIPSGTGTGATTLAVGNEVANTVQVGDFIKVGNTSVGTQYLRVTGISTPLQTGANTSMTLSFESPYTLSTNFSANTVERKWEYFNSVQRVPGKSEYQLAFGNNAVNDEVHIVVTDQDGLFTGTPGTILEVYQGLSRATNAKNENGSSIFYKTVINNASRYVWAASDLSTAASNTALLVVNSSSTKPITASFQGGQDGQNENDVSLGVVAAGYDLFVSADDIDISLILQGVAKGGSNGTGLANYIVANIAEVRKDCLAVLSPEKADVVGANGAELDNVLAYRNSLSASSYAVMDSGYKWQYDKYNDTYRYIPLNGDIGGVIARNDSLADPWFSPAGSSRGAIKNVVRLAWNPSHAFREQLAKADINPVTSLQGQGPLLYGDKTIYGRSSAFRDINVRRLFIVLEKAISRAAAALLFEINDEFTRAQFRNMVEPYLREIAGRRGITDFQVVCDETNNTGQVIDNNGFVGDIYIKPARSINTIQLNFVAARTSVEFSEIVGKF